MVFFGTLSLFSYEVLCALIKLEIEIKTIVIAKHAPQKIQTGKNCHIDLVQTSKHKTIELLAIEQNIPIIYVHNIDDAAFFTRISACKADIIVVACFPYLIPQSIYDLPKQASVNIHPSLLPAFRGPSPIFWQLKAGLNVVAVTIHKLNQQFDEGTILRQKAVPLKDGMRGRAIDRLLANCAAQMLQSLIASQCIKLANNTHNHINNTHGNSGYYPMPRAKDFIIPLTWSARRAFNFMRATQEWNLPYPIEMNQQQFFLLRALAYAPMGRQSATYQIEDNIISIRFAEGLLQALIGKL